MTRRLAAIAVALALPLAGCGEGSQLSGVSMRIGACEIAAGEALPGGAYSANGLGVDADLTYFAVTYIHACMREAGWAFDLDLDQCQSAAPTRDAACYRFDGRISTWFGTIF